MYHAIEEFVGNTPLVRLKRIPGPARAPAAAPKRAPAREPGSDDDFNDEPNF